MLGPKIQRDLFEILIRFRFHKVALSADIAKMYRQVLLDKEDKDFHRILWKETPSSTLEYYRMTRNTYGVTSAGFHAIRPLFELPETTQHPIAALALKSDMYVDDLLTGTASKEEAELLQDTLIKHLANATFHLRKWSSSDLSLVERLPETYRESADTRHIESEEYFIKTLGVVWKPKQDIFTINVEPADKAPQTKRQILSEVTRIFDPLGLLSPIVIQLKSFIQALWLDNLSWDQPLNHNLLQQYKHLSRDLKSVEDIDTPRFILDKNEPSKNPLQLHCFCDASTTAYAAVVYIRQPVSQGHFQSQLLVAKTRVAPIKTLCVPRLELCAALLGAQLVQSIRIALDDERFPNLKVFAWTDSTITLAWLKNHPSLWKTFVANRVAKIQKSVPAENWNHVPTESNPADCASRGMSPRKLQSHHLWWQGPEWLRMPASAWPQIDIALPEESLKEAKRLNNSVQLDYRKLVSINTHDDTTQKQPSLVYLPVRKQAILNHNKEETAATAKAPEEEEPKEQADDQEEEEQEEEDEEEEEEEEEEQEQEEEEEEEEEPQPHPENSSQSHQSNHTSRDYTDADNAILVAANKFSSFKKLVKVFGFVLRLFQM